jgi:hypothetical protein
MYNSVTTITVVHFMLKSRNSFNIWFDLIWYDLIRPQIPKTADLCHYIQGKLPYLQECNMRFFSSIWCLIMWGHLKFVYEATDQTTTNWIILIQTVLSQTKISTAKSSCVDKWEKWAWLKLKETIVFFRHCPLSNIFKKHNVSEARSVCIIRHRST